MPREVICLPVSKEPLYEATAVFLAILAYPDDPTRRNQFCTAYCREHLRALAKQDTVFASAPQPIRPGLFLITDAAVEDEMRAGGGRLAERKEAYIATHMLFDAAVGERRLDDISGFELMPDRAENRAIMTRSWREKEQAGDVREVNLKALSGNLTTRVLNPSRPVIHVAAAYWRTVLDLRRLRSRDDGEGERPVFAEESDAERAILHDRLRLRRMLSIAEAYRRLAPSIPELKVGEGDLIEFRTV
jgi:hypothetical protein